MVTWVHGFAAIDIAQWRPFHLLSKCILRCHQVEGFAPWRGAPGLLRVGPPWAVLICVVLAGDRWKNRRRGAGRRGGSAEAGALRNGGEPWRGNTGSRGVATKRGCVAGALGPIYGRVTHPRNGLSLSSFACPTKIASRYQPPDRPSLTLVPRRQSLAQRGVSDQLQRYLNRDRGTRQQKTGLNDTRLSTKTRGARQGRPAV